MRRIRRVAGKYVAGMTPVLTIPAMLSFEAFGGFHQRQVTLIGIDEATYGQVGDFNRYLQHPANRRGLEFKLREGGYDTVDHDGGPDALTRRRMDVAGWAHRRMWAQFHRDARPPAALENQPAEEQVADEQPPDEIQRDGWIFERGERLAGDEDPAADAGGVFDPATQTHTGAVIGIALASYRLRDGSDEFLLLPGDDVEITVPTASTPPRVAAERFTIVDFYESKLSEYDSNDIFVPLATLQRMREMIDPDTGVGSVTSIQIKLNREADGDTVRDLLRAEFPAATYGVETWRDQQGPLLAAVNLEITILNLLVFLIIAVAGFGILAIFYMIVVEKTKDIGILKSLGAPSGGIMGVFLGYGLALGVVGAGAGLVIGLALVANIDGIVDGVAALTGEQLFDPTVYYFQEIPAIVRPFTVTWIVLGALLIAVLASVLPARRAARLHPVEALRHK